MIAGYSARAARRAGGAARAHQPLLSDARRDPLGLAGALGRRGAQRRRAHRGARGMSLQSAVAAPITVAGRAWGVIAIARRSLEALPAETEARLGEFARARGAGDRQRRRRRGRLHQRLREQFKRQLRIRRATRRISQQRLPLIDVKHSQVEHLSTTLHEHRRLLHQATSNRPTAAPVCPYGMRSRTPIRREAESSVTSRLPRPTRSGATHRSPRERRLSTRPHMASAALHATAGRPLGAPSHTRPQRLARGPHTAELRVWRWR